MQRTGKTSKQTQAYENIKKAIISNEFTSDTMLTESMLCARFGFSRTPVREALQRLRSEGFIDYVVDKGAFVPQIGLDDLLQYYEIREALEGMAAKLCALRFSPEIDRDLSSLLEKIRTAYNTGKYNSAMNFDMDFHRAILHACKNARLESTMNNVLDLISCVAYKADDASTIRTSLDAHERILEAMRRREDTTAEQLMREHIIYSKKYHIGRYYRLD